MSNFWSKALGGEAVQPPRTVPQPSPAGQPWWQSTFIPPQQTPVQQYEQAITHPAAPVPHQAISARSTETCPNCGSGNYTAGISASANTMTRCFECGYNPRFDQMAYAASGGSPTTATRQAASTNGGFHPQMIVGKA